MKLGPDELKLSIRYALCANIPLLSWGGSGAGKSAITRQAAEEEYENILEQKSYLYHTIPAFQDAIATDSLGLEIHDLRLAHVDISEWGLLRTFVEIRLASGVMATVPVGAEIPHNAEVIDYVHMSTRPHWFPREDSTNFHVLFMDEPNRAEDQTAINGTMQILAERALKHRPASPGFRIIGAANPPAGNFATEELNTASQNRWCHVDFLPDQEQFLANRTKYLDPFAHKIISSRKDLLIKEQFPTTWSASSQAFHTPRVWELQSRLGSYVMWKASRGETVNTDVLSAMTHGLLGLEAGREWMIAYEEGFITSLDKLIDGTHDFSTLLEAGSGFPIYMAFQIRANLDDSFLQTPEQGERLARFIIDLSEYRKDTAATVIKKLLGSSSQSGSKNIEAYLLRHPKIIKFITALRKELW